MFSTTNLLTILLAIPAVLAAPATEAKAAAKQVKACACVNAAGQTGAVDGYCQYIAGGIVNLDGQKYCFPGAVWSEHMDTTYTDDFCSTYYPAFPKGNCKTTTVCPTIGDYQHIC
ncbi:hypothetical protein FPOA_09090 [Fusarium poae]|uniref:Uncharacterized protein n=1 Tax=Fusarium poae TaxID=36050 RepID=A0A1B8AQE0_FUSPO|nr:hypothetical protein FPOA_09090 [Fusarium poae]